MCEHHLTSPVLHPPANLSVAPGPDPSSLALSWARGQGWGPTHWRATACPLRHLGGPLVAANCTEVRVEGAATAAVVEGLEPYTEYRVAVTGQLGRSGLSREVEEVARTHPTRPVLWEVTLDGRLLVVWQDKVAAFAGEQGVHLTWSSGGGDGGGVRGTAHRTVVPRLVLGRTYTATLREVEEGKVEEEQEEGVTFQFTACKYSAGPWCNYWPSNE